MKSEDFCSNKICFCISFDGYEPELCIHPTVTPPSISKYSFMAYLHYGTVSPWGCSPRPLLPAGCGRRPAKCGPQATTGLSFSRKIFAAALRQHSHDFQKLLSPFVQRCCRREVAQIQPALPTRGCTSTGERG